MLQPLADGFLTRLRSLGLRDCDACSLTNNRRVMVSVGGRVLRVHRGYLHAPDATLHALIAFVEARTRRERLAARRKLLAFRIETDRPRRRRERAHPEDLPLGAQLREWHARFNSERFGGALRAIEVRVSRRMRTRLGHYAPARDEEAAEIVVSRRHLRRHGWTEALGTLLHEMVHQWQDESGMPLDHGPTFRAKARAVGIPPFARRLLAA